MKELNINNTGRMPLWQKDLDWMQKGYTEPLMALVSELGLSKDYFIITGCSPYRPSQSKLAMNAGWFWYGGKILPVRPLPATSVNQYTNPMVKLSLVHYSDPNGARAFIHADQTTGNVENVWQDDYLAPTVVERSKVVQHGVLIGVGAWTLRDILMHHTAENESDWISGRSGDLEFKRIGRMVVLRGIATDVKTNFQPVDEGFPIPLAGRATLQVPNAPGDFNIYINSNGELVCQSTGGQGEPTLTGLMYMAETPYQVTDHNTITDSAVIQNSDNPLS
jgi:hypothetical protein